MLKKTSNVQRGLLYQKKASERRPQAWTVNMIQKIISLEDNQGQKYLTKYAIEQLLLKIDKNHIQIIDRFSHYRDNAFNLLQFVRFFLNILHHQQIENLYLTIGLIDLFKTISTFAGEQRISFSHITNFFCQKILQKQESKNQIQAKNIPQINFIKPSYQVKDFIRNPPIIYGSNDQTLYKLSQASILTDKSKHARAERSSFSYELKMMFSLDALSEYIAVYDFNCNQINRIYPSCSKIKKDVVVLKFAFSQRQYRIGAVLKNFTIAFWDCTPNNSFDYEKTWSTTSYCQHLQSSIYYLDYFNEWVTSDKTGSLYFWDLLNSKSSRHFKCKYNSTITTLCQIPPLNILAVVQQQKNVSLQQSPSYQFISSSTQSNKKNAFYECNIILYNYFNGQVLNEISCQDDRVPHTVEYSEQYQVLFSAGMQKKIKLWQINPIYMDSSLKGELIGHQNLITSFTLLRKTSLLASCDDKGKIKLWDFRNFACIQTIDFSDKAMITNLLDMIQIGKIGILGSRIHYLDFQDKTQVIKKIKNKQKIRIQWIDQDQCRNQIFIFTQKDLRVLDMNKGCVKYIYGCFNSDDDDYTCFRYFSCILKFAIGNDKGEISIYDIGTGMFLYKLKTSHEGSVIGIQYDQLNKIFLSYGSDSSILMHKQINRQLIRQIKSNFYGKQISNLQLSVFHNLIAVSTHQKQFSKSVFLWNYQFGKLSGQIVLKNGCEVTSLQFINSYSILVIATNFGSIHILRIKQLTGSQIKIQQLTTLELNMPISSLICDTVIKGGNKSLLQQCVFIVSFEDGSFKEIDYTNYIKKLQMLPHSKEKSNYNPYRQSKETFSMQYMKNKHYKLEIGAQRLKKIEDTIKTSDVDEITSVFPRSVKRVRTQIEIRISNEDDYSDKQEQNTIQDKDQQLQQQKQYNRSATNLLLPSAINISPTCKSFQKELVHSGFSQINKMKIMSYQKRFILVVGNNRRLKIFNSDFKLICDLNINYPLPYIWQFKPKLHKKVQDKIYFAIKVLNAILTKYETDISVGQAKNYKLKDLFDNLNGRNMFGLSCRSGVKYTQPNDQDSSNNLMLTEPVFIDQKSKRKFVVQQKIPLIQDQYTKNDLNFDLVKKYNFHQVAGPTLKQLDHIKKIELLQRQWRQKQRQQQEDCDKLLKMIQTKVRKNQEKQQLATFLAPSSIKNKDHKQNGYVSSLRKKIQNIRLSGQKDDETKQKQKGGSLFNTSKMMNFASSMSLNRKQLKQQSKQKQRQKQDQYLLQACMKKHRSVKCYKSFDTTQTFEDYYLKKKHIHVEPGAYFKSRINTLDSFQQNKQIRAITSDKFSDLFGTSFRNQKIVNRTVDTTKSTKLEKKPATSGNKFRTILTQMNEKVRQKKLQKIKYL